MNAPLRVKGGANDERLAAILDQARWAPSGDNEQPWRFEVAGDDRVVVHGYDTRSTCVYDLDGTSSQIAIGALIETMAIAASRFGLSIEAVRRASSAEIEPVIDVRFVFDDAVVADPLAGSIERRSVQRRPLRTRPLTSTQRAAMEAAVGDAYRIVWIEGAAGLRHMAKLLFTSARLRLTMPEAYLVHRDAIEWAATFSDDRVPEAAVGLDPVAARLMRWAMQSWGRVQFLNRYLAGTWMPRLQLDVKPALLCAAHFALVAKTAPSSVDDFIAAGRATQRLWLTATSLDLQMQPEMTPLIFARYSRERRRFSTRAHADRDAADIARRFSEIVGGDAAPRAVFMGRVGHGPAAKARSMRLPLAALTYDAADWPPQKLRRTSA